MFNQHEQTRIDLRSMFMEMRIEIRNEKKFARFFEKKNSAKIYEKGIALFWIDDGVETIPYSTSPMMQLSLVGMNSPTFPLDPFPLQCAWVSEKLVRIQLLSRVSGSSRLRLAVHCAWVREPIR
jgi:hypothetical protein